MEIHTWSTNFNPQIPSSSGNPRGYIYTVIVATEAERQDSIASTSLPCSINLCTWRSLVSRVNRAKVSSMEKDPKERPWTGEKRNVYNGRQTANHRQLGSPEPMHLIWRIKPHFNSSLPRQRTNRTLKDPRHFFYWGFSRLKMFWRDHFTVIGPEEQARLKISSRQVSQPPQQGPLPYCGPGQGHFTEWGYRRLDHWMHPSTVLCHAYWQ